MEQAVRTMQQAGGGAGLAVKPMPLREWKDVDAADATLVREPIDGLLVLYDRVTSASRWNIAHVANRRGLPTVYGARHYIVDGTGLVSYGIDWSALVIGSADYLARILGGMKPADLPVLQPSRFELIVNLRLARAYGMDIPQSLLLQATEVIE